MYGGITNSSYQGSILWKMNITTYNDNSEDDPFTIMTPTWSNDVYVSCSGENNFVTIGSIVYSFGSVYHYQFDMTSQQLSRYTFPQEYFYDVYPCFVYIRLPYSQSARCMFLSLAMRARPLALF